MPGEEVLRVSHLTKSYPIRRRFFQAPDARIHALRDVSFCLSSGTTLAITGASASGKSTLARCLACLESFDSGSLTIGNQEVSRLTTSDLRGLRRRVQLVPQASAASLNPSFTVLEALREPLDIAGHKSRPERNVLALEALRRVGVTDTAAGRKTTELSAGQRQRVAIARALLLEPSVLILDESLTGLDYSVTAAIINLLVRIQEESGLAYILISHDGALIRHFADRAIVLSAGRIVKPLSAEDTACKSCT